MKVNTRPRYQAIEPMVEFEKEENKKRSGVMWVFIIVIGVFLGNVLSYGTYEIYSFWKLKIIMDAANTALEEQQLKLSEQRKIQERKNIIHKNELKQQRIERQGEKKRKNEVRSQLQKTCTFWKQQVQKENTAIHRKNRDLACTRLNNYR